MHNIGMSHTDYEFFLEKDFSRHAGNWVAIYDRRIVSSSRSIEKAIRDAKRKCSGKFLFAKIPKKNQALIL